MKLNERELLAVFNDPDAQASRPSERCPEAETFRRIAQGEAGRQEREAVADHLLACADCAKQYLALGELATWVEETTASRLPSVEIRPRRFPVWAAAAAGLVLAGGLAVFVRSASRRPAALSQERGPISPADAVAPADRARLTVAPAELTWAPLTGARTYEVTVYDFESTPLWQSPTLVGPQVSLPDTVRRRMSGGGVFYWRVSSQIGPERLLSRLHQFTVASSGP
ncbi:MAG TPA: hypothetical protein VKE50_10720 [Thermoanaerobaculia bacterium]|nr:hypothetical protein [Thermoanaerobaculia bacterium]